MSRISSLSKPLHRLSMRRCASTVSMDLSSLKGRSLKQLADYSKHELRQVLQLARALKKRGKAAPDEPVAVSNFVGRTMSMIFQKRSTRTRVSAEVAFAKLGGHALFLASDDIQLGKNESLRDTARVLSDYNDIILARVFEHSFIEDLCKFCHVPVINGLSDTYHPLQGLADIMTLQEKFGDDLSDKKVAWVGDGNNVAQTLLEAAALMDFSVSMANPKGYTCKPDVVSKAAALSPTSRFHFTHSPLEAVKGAHAIFTDTWISMGQEADAKKRISMFQGYQVTMQMAKDGGADPDWVFLHCLPRKPHEVDDEVFYSSRSLAFPEAENRMWTALAVFLAHMKGKVVINN